MTKPRHYLTSQIIKLIPKVLRMHCQGAGLFFNPKWFDPPPLPKFTNCHFVCNVLRSVLNTQIFQWKVLCFTVFPPIGCTVPLSYSLVFYQMTEKNCFKNNCWMWWVFASKLLSGDTPHSLHSFLFKPLVLVMTPTNIFMYVLVHIEILLLLVLDTF